MKHLSGMDASFLHLESPEMPMHTGGLAVLELPSGYEGDYWEDVKAHIGSRMHLAPVFTRKLALMPFELANPVWVEDDDVDLDYHVRRVLLPRPGTRVQLEAYVARLHSSLLDRSRPLWEFYVIEGLESGQAAFYIKAHHAAMDGAAGAVMADAILDTSEEPRAVRPAPPHRATTGYQLGMAELAGAAVKNGVEQYLKLLKLLPTMAKVAMSIKPPQPNEGTAGSGPLAALGQALGITVGPRTPFNVAITNQRAFAGISLPLGEVKAVAKQLGATINDVVMTMCSSALRRYLEERQSLPAQQLIASVPVSLREAGNTEMNNQGTMMTIGLATHLAEPLARLKAIHDASVKAKAHTSNVKAAIPSDFPSFGAPWLISGLASMYGRSKLADSLPPMTNVVISNVPGAQTPLYLARARMVTNYPLSIPAHGMALNLTVQSYNGALDFGITACRRAVPDVGEFKGLLRDALTELQVAAKALTPAAAVPKTAHGTVEDTSPVASGARVAELAAPGTSVAVSDKAAASKPAARKSTARKSPPSKSPPRKLPPPKSASRKRPALKAVR